MTSRSSLTKHLTFQGRLKSKMSFHLITKIHLITQCLCFKLWSIHHKIKILLIQSQPPMSKLHQTNLLLTNTLTRSKGLRTYDESEALLDRIKFCYFKITTHFQIPLRTNDKVQSLFLEVARKSNLWRVLSKLSWGLLCFLKTTKRMMHQISRNRWVMF